MSTSQPSSSTSFNRTAILLLFVGLPVLLCSGVPTWWFWRHASAARTLEEKRAEIAARGWPLDHQSLVEFRSTHMRHERSDRWMQVLDLLNSDEFSKFCVGIPIMGTPPQNNAKVSETESTSIMNEEVQAFLSKWAQLREEIHEITEGSEAIWTEGNFDSFNPDQRRLGACLTASRLLELELEDAVQRADHDQVFHTLMAMIGVSRTLEEEPSILHQLFQVSTSSTAYRNLKPAIELDWLTENQLQQILAQLRSLDDFGARYRIAIAGERAISQPVFDDTSQLTDHTVVNLLSSRPIDALASLELYDRAESINTDNLADFWAASELLENQINAEFSRANWLRKTDTVVTGLTLPAIGVFAKSTVRSAMELRLAKVGIGLRLFKIRHDRWPANLEELTTDEPTLDLGPVEPSGSEPFGYRVVEDAVEIWGFRVENVGDTTPEEPHLPTSHPNGLHEASQYWHWKLTD